MANKMNAGVSFQPLLPFGTDDAPQPRLRLVEALASACREHPLEEKILLAPSLAIGHQLAERLARSGTAWVHLRVETVRNLAHGLVGPSLVEEGLALLSRAQALALVEQACADALEPDSYFGRIKDRPGLHRALQSTFDELRAAGLSAATLPVGAFPDPKKAAELGAILSRYEQALADGKLVDRPGVLRRAIDHVRGARPAAGPFYLLPSRLELSSAERELVETVAGEHLMLLSVESPEEWAHVARSARLFRATGEENEVREVFRRLLSTGTPLDDAELLYTDSRTYPALVYELAQQYGVTATFSGGVAVDFSRPGQAALGFLAWIGGDFEEERLRSIVAAGAVDLRAFAAKGDPPSSVETARALRAASIGWGRTRHLACLDRLITELSKPEDPRRAESPEEPGASARRAARRERSLAGARAVRGFVDGALRLIPEMPSGQIALPALARALGDLVAAFARVASEFDGTSREALLHLFAELEALPPAPLLVAEAARRLADAVRDLHVDSSRPRPGALHVADYRSGGFSGRRQIFVIGLDERRHPGSGRQDPVLLDDERRDINETVHPQALAIHGDRPTENTLALQACVARLDGEVTLGFSCWNLVQASEQFPAPFLLDAHREITGNPRADYTELLAALPPPAGFLPDSADALDETEWTLSRLRDFPGGAAADSVRAAYPWLLDGKTASVERASDRFTVYDGGIGPVPELDPRSTREPISCSRIQTLARCPYAYFLHDVLGVAPPDELESDPRQWLDPKALGSLLHEVFYRFFTEISARGEKPSVVQHAARLDEIAEQLVALWRERIPPRSAAAFALCREAIAVACRTLLREEEEHCRRVTPRYFEVPFGLPRAELDSALASRESIEISLGSLRGFRLRGRIDRIDEAPDGTFHVWDYKTGSTQSISEQKGLDAGRQAQYALYAAATEQLLARAGQTARVSRSGYFFPGHKGQGQRIEPGLDIDESRRVISVLFDLLAAGALPHTPKKEDCRFCDFQPVCGNVDAVVAASAIKIEKATVPSLLAFREIRGE